MMKRVNMATCVCVGALGLLSTHACAQPAPPPWESIEDAAINADTVVIGRVLIYEGKDGYEEFRRATVAVEDTLKGERKERVTLQTSASTWDLAGWKMRSARLLLFVRAGNPWLSGIIDLADEDLCYAAADFSLLTKPDDLIRCVRVAIRRNPGVTHIESYQMRAPNTKAGEIWKERFSAMMITTLSVPADRKLEAWAQKHAMAKAYDEAESGVEALRFFKSATNVALLRPLLKSPLYAVERQAERNNGLELRRFAVREATLRVLKGWGEPVDEPVLHEEAPKFDIVESIDWNGEPTDEGLKNLAQCKKLKYLTISNAWRVNDANIKLLARVPKLKWLKIGGSRVTDAGLLGLAEIRSLRKAWVNGSEVTDEGVSALHNVRPDLEVLLEYYPNPIDYDVVYGHVTSLRALLKRNPEYRDQRDPYGNTPLHNAAKSGQYEVAKLLVELGAPVDALNKAKQTPLQLAAARHDADTRLIELLRSR